MEKVIKITPDLRFDVIYEDDSRKSVKEGILFEACEDNSMIMHFGTGRPEVVEAVCYAVIEMMEDIIEANNRTPDSDKCNGCFGAANGDCEMCNR